LLEKETIMSKQPVITGLHHIAIRAADFDRSLAFYTALGMTTELAWGEKTADKDTRAAMLGCGRGSHLELFAAPGSGAKPEGSWIHVALETADCDAAWERALKAGAKPQSEKPFEADINGVGTPSARVRIVFFHGPDGEVVEFFQRLS